MMLMWKRLCKGAVVIVNGKWRARLIHYDYERSRDLLRKGNNSWSWVSYT
jgi:hypothetical protein